MSARNGIAATPLGLLLLARCATPQMKSTPFFTYDAKQNGYVKTALLWRLFRNEWDPEKGRAVDLLFLPVWR